MSDDPARITARMPQEKYDRLCDELSVFSTDTARFQFLVQFYLDYKDMQCRCMPQAHPPAESHAPPARSQRDAASPSEQESVSNTDSVSSEKENTSAPQKEQSNSDEDEGQEYDTGQS
jgi:hypothetical protein